MQEEESSTHQEAMSYSSATLIGTNMPISTTPTNINAIILNSQIPGAQRLCTEADMATSQPTTSLTFSHQAPAGIGVTNQGQTRSGVTHQGQAGTVVGITNQGHPAVGSTQQAGVHVSVAHQCQTGVGISNAVVHQSQAGVGVVQQGHTSIGIPISTNQGQTVVGIAHQSQPGRNITNQSQASLAIAQTQASVAISQAHLPLISGAGTTLRLPSIVAVEGAIKPDISLCSRVLKSFSDQDQASSDLEVQSVMFPETRGLLPTVKRICPSRSSSSSKSSKSSYSPMRQPTTLTNAKRGNVQTTTPTFLPEDMTIHQLAAQGELTLLSERLENFEMEKVDKTDVQGYTPLIWACAHDQLDIIEYLIRYGADASKVSIEGECALSFASSNGNVEVVRLLLADNADVNNYDWNGGTPLLYAVYNNHPKCCELLLQAGADMTIETDGGHTALSLALALGHRGVQQVIEKHMLGLLQRA